MKRENDGAHGSRNAPPSDLCDYAAWAITSDLDKMLSHIREVQQNEDTEPVHDMRVASRRTRAALELFELCFSEPDYARLERRVKKVTDVLSAARDLDVMQESLTKQMRSLPADQREGLQGFIDQLHARREEQQKPVEKTLRMLEKQDLKARFKTIAVRERRKHRDG
ncbi:MAG: hypothetical protein JWL77_5593 [Chthonomonadaceae bacterium]|nr:hypothetical protein [Chthonomonadaceae bacterium]